MKKNFFYLPVILIFAFSGLTCKKETTKQDTNSQSEEILIDSRNQIINASEINEKIKTGQNIKYKNATIIGDINFLVSEDKYLITSQLINTGFQFFFTIN